MDLLSTIAISVPNCLLVVRKNAGSAK